MGSASGQSVAGQISLRRVTCGAAESTGAIAYKLLLIHGLELTNSKRRFLGLHFGQIVPGAGLGPEGQSYARHCTHS
jgi:hypothetical protein